ncbi:hypothetical protein BC828DRAFT_383726 [Blastocladiella britannica]|nr:hypothetical protein BC828DRAFT_383726 [Blastocladiella britannica]
MAARSGRGFVTKALLGSVSEYVTKHADIPVVIVRDKLQLAREAKLKAEVEMHDSDAQMNPMVERMAVVE